jgi:tetratricopeptide (TPR) repeat protein
MQKNTDSKRKDSRSFDYYQDADTSLSLSGILDKDPADKQAFSLMSNQYLVKKDYEKAAGLAYRYLDAEFDLEAGNLLLNCLISLKEFYLAKLVAGYIIDHIGVDEASCNNLEKIEKRLSKVKNKKISKKFRYIKSLLDPKKSRASLSLCMIVKDEEKNIARCLESARPVVSEIIIVDTGSIDNTRQIAAQFGAKIIDYEWEDDFAKARNHSIKHARSDFVLFLDADEVLDKSSYPFFNNLKRPKEPSSYFAKIVNLTNKDNVQSSAEHFSTRLWTNHPSFKFSGRVHEVLIFTDDALMHRRLISGITIVHHGYMQDLMRERNKFERNLKLLKSAIEDEPGNPFHEYNLGVHYQAMGKMQKALDHFSIMQEKLGGRKTSYLPFSLSYAAAAYNELGLYEKAIESARKAISLNKGLKDAYFNIARAQMKMEKYEEAAENFNKILSTENNVLIGGTIDTGTRSWKTINGLGICYMALSKNREALECFEKAFDLKKDSAIILGNLITSYHKTGQNKKIPGLLEEVRNNTYTIGQAENITGKLRNIGEREAALAFVSNVEDSYRKKDKEEDADGTSLEQTGRIRAKVYYDGKEYKEACKYYSSYFERGFSDPLSLENWGIACLKLGDFKKAEEIFARLIKDNKSWSAYHNLGTAAMSLNKADQALRYLEKADKIKPGNAETLFNLGKLMLFKKDYREAEDRLFKAADADKNCNHPEIAFFISQSLYLQEKYRQASELLVKYLEDNDDAGAYDLLGLCLCGMEEYDEAILCFSEAIEIDNTRASYFNNLGNALAKLGNSRDSKNAYHCALLLDPENKRARAGMQSLLIKEGLSRLS